MNKITPQEQKLYDRLQFINMESFSDRPLTIRGYSTDGQTIAIEEKNALYGRMVKEICNEFNEVFFTHGEIVIYD